MKRNRMCLSAVLIVLGCAILAAAEKKPKKWVPADTGKERVPECSTVPPGFRTVLDLPYIEGGHERNRLDLFLPEKPDGIRPLVVWVHGGAWCMRDKAYCVPLWLLPKGYILASIDYRLSQHAVFPAQIEDCKAAIRWLRANAAKYHFDPRRIGVWGASAGGHLVNLLGTTVGVKGLEGKGGNFDQSSRVQCVVDWCGPPDLAACAGPNLLLRPAVEQLLGGPLPQKKELARQASPLTYVGKDSAPFLIVHGDQDTTVPLGQSERLAAALKKAGVEVTLVVVKGAPHGGPRMYNPPQYKLVEAFLAKHLGR